MTGRIVSCLIFAAASFPKPGHTDEKTSAHVDMSVVLGVRSVSTCSGFVVVLLCDMLGCGGGLPGLTWCFLELNTRLPQNVKKQATEMALHPRCSKTWLLAVIESLSRF